MYDVMVIGGGPAGISAAICAVSRGKKTVVFEKAAVCVTSTGPLFRHIFTGQYGAADRGHNV